MPESKRRKPKRPNRTRQRLAAADGERIPTPGFCCDGLEVEITAVGKINARHDDRCPALNPADPDHVPARVAANAGAAKAIQSRGIRPMVVMLRR